MRIRGVSEDGEDLTKLLPTLEAKFASVGLTLKKDDKTFKSTYEIFEDLASVWDRLSDFQQAEFVELVAGKHQGNIAASMIANWKDAQDSLEAGLNSFGSAARENEIYLESMQGKITQFKNAVNAFWSGNIESDFLKSLIDSGTTLIGVLSKITDTFGGLGTIIGIVTLGFMAFNSKLRANSIAEYITKIKALDLGMKALNISAVGARIAVTALHATMTLGLSVAIAGLVGWISSLVSKHKEEEQALKAVEEQNKNIANSYNENSEKIHSLVDQYNELNEVTKNGSVFSDTAQEEKYRSVIEQLSTIMPNLVDKIDEKGNKHLKNKDAIQAEIETTKELARLQRQQTINTGRESFDETLKGIEEANKKLKKFEEDKAKSLDKGLKWLAIPGKDSMDKVIETTEKYKTAAEINILQTQNEIANQTEGLKSQILSMTETLLSFSNIKISDSARDVLKEVIGGLDKSKIDTAEELVDVYQSLAKATELIGKDSKTNEETARLNELLLVLGLTDTQVISLKSSMVDLNKEMGDSTPISTLTSKLQGIIDNASDSKKEIDFLNKAQKELKDTNHLSIDSISKMNEMYGDYIDIAGKSKEEIYKYIAAKKEERIAVIEAEKEKAKVFIQTARASITAMKLANSVNLIPMPDSMFALAETGLNKLEEKLGLVDAVTKDLTYTSKENEREQEKSNDTFSETNEILTETQKRLRDIQTELDKLNNKRSKIKKGSAEYRKSLMEEISLLKEQKKLYEDGIKNPEKLVSTKVTTSSKSASSSGYTGTVSSSSPTNVSGNYASIINHYASQYGVDPKLIAAIIQTESTFNPNAVSSAGAQGLMQLMPGTAKGLGVKNSFDPEQNIKGGTSHFARLVKKYNGDIELALYAYNAGEGNVDKWIKSGQINNIPYRETREYAPKVLANYNAVGGAVTTSSVTSTPSVSTSGSAKNKITLPSQSELDEAKNNAINTVSSLESTIYNKVIDFINDVATESNNKIEKFENNIAKSENKQSKYSETSKEWRKEEMSQISYLTKQQDELHNQNERLKQLVKEKQITSGEFDKLTEENSLKWLELEAKKKEKTYNVFISSMDEIANKREEIDSKIAFSNAKLSSLTEGTEKYNKELLSQIPLLKEQQQLASKEADGIREQLKKDKLTIADKEKLTQRLQELSQEWWNYNAAIKSINETIARQREEAADKIIENYKRMLEKEKELALKAYQEQTDAENKRHEQRVNNLNEELKLFEDVIAAQLESLDRQYSEDDYNTELNSKLKEQQKIQDDINKLSLDDSIEGKAKKKQLEEQLAAKEDEIFKFRQDRERELRKQNLNDQLEAKRDQLEQEKNAVEKNHEENLKTIDDEKKAKEQYYNDILEDEEKYYLMKQNLMSEDSSIVQGELDKIKGEYASFFDFLQKQAFETSKAMQNINYGFSQDFKNVEEFPPSVGNNQKEVAWSDYLNNKKRAEDLTREVIQIQRGKNPDAKAIKSKQDEIASLSSKNKAYRTQYGFPDGRYDELKGMVMSAKTGGMTPAWGPEGKFLLAHEKELILNKTDTANLITAVDIARSMANKLKNVAANLLMPKSSTPAMAGVTEIYMPIHIEKLNGDEAGANSFFTTIKTKLNNLGGER